MINFFSYRFLWDRPQYCYEAPVVSLTCTFGNSIQRNKAAAQPKPVRLIKPHRFYILLIFLSASVFSFATNYTVSDKATLLTRMTAALPGDTVIVANGTYDWGQINFSNNNGTS